MAIVKLPEKLSKPCKAILTFFCPLPFPALCFPRFAGVIVTHACSLSVCLSFFSASAAFSSKCTHFFWVTTQSTHQKPSSLLNFCVCSQFSWKDRFICAAAEP